MNYKNKTVRCGVFETNSSSSHSMAISFGFKLTAEELEEVVRALEWQDDDEGVEEILYQLKDESIDGHVIGYDDRWGDDKDTREVVIFDKDSSLGFSSYDGGGTTEIKPEKFSQAPKNNLLEDIGKVLGRDPLWVLWYTGEQGD